MPLTLMCTEFRHGAAIPARFTCDGENVSPPLLWSGAPTGTVSFVLLAGDADAPGGTVVHWTLYDLPKSVTRISAGVPPLELLPQLGRARQGKTSFGGAVGYHGPCPPRGAAPHRYSFHLYALDRMLGLPAAVPVNDLRKAVQGHVLGEAELMGTYGRK